MTSLQVRDLPEHLYKKIKMQAKKEHRSLAQQAVYLLEKGLDSIENPKSRRKQVLKKISETKLIGLDKKIKEPEKLIREDRER
jgi:plasmid stability protein